MSILSDRDGWLLPTKLPFRYQIGRGCQLISAHTPVVVLFFSSSSPPLVILLFLGVLPSCCPVVLLPFLLCGQLFGIIRTKDSTPGMAITYALMQMVEKVAEVTRCRKLCKGPG